RYDILALFDESKEHQSGSTIPIKLELTCADGDNDGSASTSIQGLYVLDQNGNQVPLQDAGKSNPNDLFRYDAGGGIYLFNLQTKGYAAGVYTLCFEVGDDLTPYSVTFVIR